MDIYELRRKTNVYNHGQHSKGASIFYKVGERYCSLHLNNDTLFKELNAIGSLDAALPAALTDYTMSQWDAINIAIRNELAKEQEKELNDSDIFNAIANIIKPTNEQGNAY